MGYNDNGVVKVDQEFFQPCDRIQIQVVGRLVQKQDIRVSEQCLCKKNFDLLRTCQVSSSVYNEALSRYQVRSEGWQHQILLPIRSL